MVSLSLNKQVQVSKETLACWDHFAIVEDFLGTPLIAEVWLCHCGSCGCDLEAVSVMSAYPEDSGSVCYCYDYCIDVQL